jgi:eukaryotic-like serine/threonine-protein kinase
MRVEPRGRPLCPGYRALRLLRRGRDLDVYDAWSEKRACRCVAKTVRRDKLHDQESHASLLLEAKLLLALSHPHLVRAYELVRAERPILVMETLTGATLSKLIHDHPKGFPARDLLFLGIHLCSALTYLHGSGYLHLDVKPSNVVGQAGIAKLIDLSLAARVGRRLPGNGTPRYMSPEQIEGRPLTAAADVWGVGCVLYEAARGSPAFANPRGRRYAQLSERPRALRGESRLPRPAAKAIDACLHPDPSARPSLHDLSATFRASL